MTLLLGIDLGTSYFKVGLFSETGVLAGLGRVVVTPTVSAPGRSELSLEAFWKLLRLGMAEALLQARADVAQIAGMAYSSQANTFVLLDDQDAPLTPLVLWTDERAAQLDEQWRQFTLTDEFACTTGFRGSSSRAAAAKWLWFQKNEPKLWARTRAIMTISDYLTFALTGERVGDAGTAALLGIYDLHAQAWWPKARQNYGVASKRLSQPLHPGSPIRRTVGAAAKLLGLPAGVPFAVGGLDHHVAAFGAGLGTVAEASISTGTVLAAVTLAEEVRPQAGCYHGPQFGGSDYYRLAFDPSGAGQVEEYRQAFAPECSLEELLLAAGEISAGQQSSQPPTRRDARPAEHAAPIRGLLEKIAMGHRTLLHRLLDAKPLQRVVATGGGARSEVWLQIKADLLGVPVIAPLSPECACLGAAMLAGVAAGLHQTPMEAAKSMVRVGKTYLPNPVNVALYREREQLPAGPKTLP